MISRFSFCTAAVKKRRGVVRILFKTYGKRLYGRFIIVPVASFAGVNKTVSRVHYIYLFILLSFGVAGHAIHPVTHYYGNKKPKDTKNIENGNTAIRLIFLANASRRVEILCKSIFFDTPPNVILTPLNAYVSNANAYVSIPIA